MAKENLQFQTFNPNNIAEITQLVSDAESAQATISTLNAQGYTANDYVLVGVEGSDRGEIKKIQSVSGNNLTMTTNFSVKHFTGESVKKLKGYQVKFYKASNTDGTVPADASFSSIATVTIEGDQNFVNYLDTSGGSDYWYKGTFYNPDSGYESSLSDSSAIRGGQYGRFVTVQQVKKSAGLSNNEYIDDADVLEIVEEVESEIKGVLISSGYALSTFNNIPRVLRRVAKDLASGILLVEQYGVEHEGTNKDGTARINRARKVLTGISEGAISLYDDVTGVEIESSLTVVGYPTGDEDIVRLFSVDDEN